MELLSDRKYTARTIADRLRTLEKELQELNQACVEIEDSLGKHTTAYKLLDEAYIVKKKEFNVYANTEWRIN